MRGVVEIADFDEVGGGADGGADLFGDQSGGGGLLIELAVDRRDIRTGEVGFDAVGTAFDGPAGAEGEVGGELVEGPIGFRCSDDGDGEDFFFREAAPGGFDVGSPDVGWHGGHAEGDGPTALHGVERGQRMLRVMQRCRCDGLEIR